MTTNRKIIRRSDPRRLAVLLQSWDNLICDPPATTLGMAKRAAAAVVAETIKQGRRPDCAPGLWLGFIHWCEVHQIRGAEGLQEVGPCQR